MSSETRRTKGHKKRAGVDSPSPHLSSSYCLLSYFAYAEFGQVQFVCANLPGYYLRWIWNQRGQISLSYEVRSHRDGFFCTSSLLEDTYSGKTTGSSV